MGRKDDEKVREALVNGASRHRIAERVVARCMTLPSAANKRLAAIAQLVAILRCDPKHAKALVDEFLI